MDNGLFPYTKRYLGTLRNHFSTLGVNGINEMCATSPAAMFDITSAEGHAWRCACSTTCVRACSNSRTPPATCTTWKRRLPKGRPTVLPRKTPSATPASCRPARPSSPYYTNSSQLPVGYTDDPFEALELQDELQRKYTGGTVLHLYMTESVSSAQACRELVKRALTRFRLPYITVTPTFSICPTHGLPGWQTRSAPSATRPT